MESPGLRGLFEEFARKKRESRLNGSIQEGKELNPPINKTPQNSKKLLALDYDGCIVDSVMEALFVSYISYRKHINKKTKIFDGRQVRVENFLNFISDYRFQVKEFRRYRPYIKDASDYAVILYGIENNLNLGSDKRFFEIKDQIPNEDLKKYYECFYGARNEIIHSNFDAWAELTPPFGCIDSIRKLANRYETLIVTTNAAECITGLLAEPYLNLHIEEKNIVDLHVSTDKVVHMKHITRKRNVRFEDMHFVDDNLNHLLATEPLGVNVYLATWGYCTKEQKAFAEKKENIILLTEDTVYSVLDASLQPTE